MNLTFDQFEVAGFLDDVVYRFLFVFVMFILNLLLPEIHYTLIFEAIV